ncbi:MAG: glycosyltransferase family 4 protein [Chloroflexota bacterium]
MKILFLTQVLPYPLDAGPKTRSYFVLQHLAQEHRITLVSFVRSSDPPEAIAHLEALCEKVITVPMQRSTGRDLLALGRSLRNGIPFLITRDWMPAMVQRIRELVSQQSFDYIHADQFWMAPYALKAHQEAQRKGKHPVVVLDQHNAMFLIPQRMAANTRDLLARGLLQREARLMARYEIEICRQFDRLAWVTEEDRQAVAGLDSAGLPESTVIPICIDPHSIPAVETLSPDAAILFVGGMHWPPNAEGVRWFAREVLPVVRERLPQARFCAIGKAPPQELKGIDGILSPGYMKAVEPYWAQSRVFIVPLRAGGGMRVKILDAWGRGLPVVSTPIGAEGIAYRDGESILIADTPEAFAQAVIQTLTEPGLAERLGQNGRRWVEERYDWRKIYTAWDAIYAG